MRRLVTRDGFTMIELLIVIIIGILAAIAIPMFVSQRARAKDAAVEHGVHAIEIGIETWAVDHDDQYPPVAEVDVGGEVGPMIAAWPLDPFNGGEMVNGTEVGNFAYGVSFDRRTFTLVGFTSGGTFVIR